MRARAERRVREQWSRPCVLVFDCAAFVHLCSPSCRVLVSVVLFVSPSCAVLLCAAGCCSRSLQAAAVGHSAEAGEQRHAHSGGANTTAAAARDDRCAVARLTSRTPHRGDTQ